MLHYKVHHLSAYKQVEVVIEELKSIRSNAAREFKHVYQLIKLMAEKVDKEPSIPD